ncbi:MAG: iron hydrogenase [Clostridiales bacterium]|jgi:iron only hydrogenase large subunit-like protein|nr:iron hydrogenase [Clostridiales bacterium]
MLTFEELYKKVVESSTTKAYDEDLAELQYDPYHLECILRPESTPTKWQAANEDCRREGRYFVNCLFKHLSKDENNNYTLEYEDDKCKDCMDVNKVKKLLATKDSMAVLEAIKEGNRPVFAMIAPAFLSQIDIIDDGQLRSAFKQLGFKGMVEVSLLADILTLKEALEFDKDINDEKDFQLTSCCCPMWIALIRKMYPELLSHVPKAVSPMVATGRVIKKIVPEAITVFIGPCIAKKKEAREDDIRDAVDYVLTFQEVENIFETAKVTPDDLPIDLREHSSAAGRIYAVTSGVSEAVRATVNRIRPEKPIKVKAVQANGMVECKKLLKDLEEGKVKANFLEGMGCIGGCVGGPKAIIDKEIAANKVREYADQSIYKTPIDNPYVIELLSRLNMHTIEELLEDQQIFTRSF